MIKQFPPLITNWISYTPTGTWVANTAYTGLYRLVGDSLECQIKVTCNNAPTTAGLNVAIPTQFVIDTTKLLATDAIGRVPLGILCIHDNSPAEQYLGFVTYATTALVAFVVGVANTTYANFDQVTQAAPITFAADDYCYAKFAVPIKR